MSNRFSTGITQRGTRLQGGISKGNPASSTLRANGMTFRGVVVAVYTYDSTGGGDYPPQGPIPPINSIYCDVLCYGRHDGLIRRVLVTYDSAGMHDGHIRAPRATSKSVTGKLNLNITNPIDMDGDHVVVGFLEDMLNVPYIQRYLSHPKSDLQNDGKDLGQRMRLIEADGQPDLRKHHGTAWGVDARGNFLVDTRTAHDGTYLAGCVEPEASQAGEGDDRGNTRLKLPKGAIVEIQVEGGASLRLENKAGNAKLTIGNGAVKVAVADHLQALYEELKGKLDSFEQAVAAHTHIVATTGTAVAQSGTAAPSTPALVLGAPAWEPLINSSQVLIPDTIP